MYTRDCRYYERLITSVRGIVVFQIFTKMCFVRFPVENSAVENFGKDYLPCYRYKLMLLSRREA